MFDIHSCYSLMLYRYIVCVYVYACVLVGFNRKHKSLQIGVVRGGTLTILQIFL